ncbi:type II toxin-antitoxin system HicB family antitoxin [bacterium]|nr:type II toxin-antitoxin system HicB family antitoxin [bacterium]
MLRCELSGEFFPDEDDGYVADCPALQGCVFHGATLEEAEANIKDATRLYLLTAGRRAVRSIA